MIIHGNYNDQNIIPILVDSTGRPLVVLGPSTSNIGDVDVLTMPVTQVKGSNSNKIFAYESFKGDNKSNLSLATGANVLDCDAIATNKIGIVTNIAAIYVGTVAGVSINILLYISSVEYYIKRFETVTSGGINTAQGEFIIPSGGKLRAYILGATAGDDAYLMYTGYLMDVS